LGGIELDHLPAPLDRLNRLPHRARLGAAALELLTHVPAALLFSLAHVGGFIGKLVYRLWDAHYDFGTFLPHFRYELSKDVIGYALIIGTFALVEHLLRQKSLIETPGQTLTFDIRDGASVTRVRLSHAPVWRYS